MRLGPFACAGLLLLAGCTGQQPYTAQDLHQVRTAYRELRPTYIAFKQAYGASNARGIVRQYHREQIECRMVDRIDARDTIDPNTDLFEASVGLDNFCNAIEQAYAYWARTHGQPVPKGVAPSAPDDPFLGSDKSLAQMPVLLRHPAALA